MSYNKRNRSLSGSRSEAVRIYNQRRRINQLENENQQLKENIQIAIEFIDQELQYHLSPFEYKQVDEDINTLIGILRRGNK